MKKLKLSVAALALALSSNAQQAYIDTIVKKPVTKEAIIAKNNHQNLYEIVIRAEDMLDMLEKDVYDGHIQDYYIIYYNKLLVDIINLAVETK